jgi:hypothetical protein
MKVFLEKEAEDFLENNGFDVVGRSFASGPSEVSDAILKVGLPCVLKVYGKGIIHKNKVNGIRLNLKTHSEALVEFYELMRIKGAKGVIFQKVFSGKEFLLGIKKTPEFGQVIVFGSGGIDVEDKKDVSFRVFPAERSDFREMIKETKIGKKLGKLDVNFLLDNLVLLNNLCKVYPDILELDINPLIVRRGKGVVVDAQFIRE